MRRRVGIVTEVTDSYRSVCELRLFIPPGDQAADDHSEYKVHEDAGRYGEQGFHSFLLKWSGSELRLPVALHPLNRVVQPESSSILFR